MPMLFADAIILRTWDFGESDLFVSFLTERAGRLKGVAKGARRSRKRFANCLDLFSLSRIEYGRNQKGGPYFLHSCNLVEAYAGLRKDFSSLSLAGYMVELVEALFPENVAEDHLFPLVTRAFRGLSDGGPNEGLRAAFEARVMSLGGYGVRVEACSVCRRPYRGEGRAVFVPSAGGIACTGCISESERNPGLSPGSVKTLVRMQSAEWDEEEAEDLDAATLIEIRKAMRLHIRYHVGRDGKSARYLE